MADEKKLENKTGASTEKKTAEAGATANQAQGGTTAMVTPDPAKAEADRKAGVLKQIAEKTALLNAAIAKRKMYEGDDEDVKATREFMQSQRKTAWDIIQNTPTWLQDEINALKDSLLTDEDRKDADAWRKANEAIADATKKRDELKAAILARNPQSPVVAGEKPAKSAKTGGTTAKADENKPFTGVLNTVEVDTVKVQELVAKGVSSETIMIQTIYGNDFTIQGSSPRAQIHGIRVKLGLVNKG